MTKRIIIIISSVILFIFLVVIIKAAMKPKPFSWIPTYSSYDKQPYGGALIFRQLKTIFPGKKVKRFGSDDFSDYYLWVSDGVSGIESLSYEYDEDYNNELYSENDSILWLEEDGKLILDTIRFKDAKDDFYYDLDEVEVEDEQNENAASPLELINLDFDSTYLKLFNIVMISDHFWCDELNTRALLLHAYQGNDVLIAAEDFNENIEYFLGIQTQLDTVEIGEEKPYSDEFVISIYDDPPVQLRSYRQYNHITQFPDSATVIAKNKAGDVLGIQYQIGEGSVTLFSVPLIFTNYYLLKQENTVAENLLLALPNRDTYYGNSIFGKHEYPERESLLSFIHSQEALTWAFYTIIFSLLFLLAFQIKRRQRIIPVMAKPQNDSLRFVEVITNLYLLNKNNKSLLKKKMTYFLEMIRSKYHLNTSVVNEVFFQQLSTKSKVDLKTIKTIFRDYDILVNQEQIPNPELLHFNKKIQHFKHRK